MTMNYEQFIERVIADGIEGARQDYKDHKLDGAIEGFEACRGKQPHELLTLLGEANRKMQALYDGDLKAYWKAVCYRGEVEWVCNCVSAMLANQGLPTIIIPTAGGAMNAARIIGTLEQ